MYRVRLVSCWNWAKALRLIPVTNSKLNANS